jgi:hypothetical protein
MYQNFNREQQLTIAGGRQKSSARKKIEERRMAEIESMIATHM